jgi:hypothetical protein
MPLVQVFAFLSLYDSGMSACASAIWRCEYHDYFFWVFHELNIGVRRSEDLSRSADVPHISICVLSEAGQITHRSRVRSIEQMLQILKGRPDRFEFCYEPSCGYGHFHDLVQPRAARVLVASCAWCECPNRRKAQGISRIENVRTRPEFHVT